MSKITSIYQLIPDSLKKGVVVEHLPSRIVVTVTAELAAYWLEFSRGNRPEKDRYQQRYSEDMVAGVWKDNGETISFGEDANGVVLLDGHHRLHTCIEANKIKAKTTFKVTVVFGLDPNVFSTINTGASRTGSDALYISGEKPYSHLLTRYTTLIWRHTRNTLGMPDSKPTNSQRIEILRTDPIVMELFKEAQSLKMKDVMKTDATTAFTLYLGHTINQLDGTRKFLQEIKSRDNTPGSPALAFINMVIKNQTKDLGHNDKFIALIIKALNAYFSKQKIALLKIAENEDFPKLKQVGGTRISINETSPLKEIDSSENRELVEARSVVGSSVDKVFQVS